MEVTRTFDLIDLNCEKYPRNDMYGGKQEKEWITFSAGEVRELVNLVSYGFLSLGFSKGDKIATISGNRPEWNFVDLGLAQAGLIHVPIYPTISTEEYNYILEHSEVKAIIVGNKSIYNKVKPAAEKLFLTDRIFSLDYLEGVRPFSEITDAGKRDATKYARTVEDNKRSTSPDDLVTIIYTSGTTGNSKGVMLSHRNLVMNAISTSKAHHLGYGHRAMSFLPLCHVYERMMNYHLQYKGISIYYLENLGMVSEAVREIKPHIFNTVPRLLEKIYNNILSRGRNLPLLSKAIFFWAVNLGLRYQLTGNTAFYRFKLMIARKLVFSKWQEALGGRLQVMVAGGAALQGRLERIFWAAGLPVVQGYGLTETSPVIAVNPFRIPEIRFGTVGPVLENVEVRIADDGEILCRGINVMKGYFKAPEMTAEVIDADGWFHTGDIGIFEQDKWLKITDRKKEMFKLSAGKYIAPQVIENRLKESFLIEQAMVIGENQKFASALISPNFAFLHEWCAEHKIEYRDNTDLIEIHEVIERISREVKEVNRVLGEHEQIKRFRLVTEEWSPQTGELSPTLKLKRNLLSQRYRDIIADIYFEGEKEEGVLSLLKNSINGILKNLPKF